MCLFICHQGPGPEFVPSSDDHYRKTGYEVQRAWRYEGRVPHGISGVTEDGQNIWGPDAFGYTDQDDYRTEVLGA